MSSETSSDNSEMQEGLSCIQKILVVILALFVVRFILGMWFKFAFSTKPLQYENER